MLHCLIYCCFKMLSWKTFNCYLFCWWKTSTLSSYKYLINASCCRKGSLLSPWQFHTDWTLVQVIFFIYLEKIETVNFPKMRDESKGGKTVLWERKMLILYERGWEKLFRENNHVLRENSTCVYHHLVCTTSCCLHFSCYSINFSSRFHHILLVFFYSIISQNP